MKEDNLNWLFNCLSFVGFNMNKYRYFVSKEKIKHKTGPGLYMFEDGGEIVYIGSTKRDLKTRLNEHKSKGIYEGESIWWFPAGELKSSVVHRVERGLIFIIWPEKNDKRRLSSRSKA